MKLRLTISACCLFFSLVSFAQIQLALKEKIKISNSRKVVSVSTDKADEFFRVFEQVLGTKKIEKGPFAGTDFVEKLQGLIMPNGKEIYLGKTEQIVGLTNSQLLTLTPNYNESTTQLINYEVSNNAIAKLGEKKLNMVEFSPILLDNGATIISDESEGYGFQVRIYSKNLKVINEYIPFNSGFRRALFSYNSGKIVCAFESEENLIKIAVFNAVTGKLLNEGVISEKTRLQVMQSFSNYILIYGSNKLTCVDLNGSLLWSIPTTLSHLNLFHDNQSEVYCFTREQLFSLNAKTGIVKWSKQLDELYTANQKGSNQVVRVISFKAFHDSINVIFSMAKRGTLSEEDPKSNSEVIILSKSGDLLQKIPLSSNTKILSVRSTTKGIQIIQDQEILIYER